MPDSVPSASAAAPRSGRAVIAGASSAAPGNIAAGNRRTAFLLVPLLVGWLRPSFVGRPAFAAPAAARAAILLLAVAGTLLVAKDADAQ